MLLWRFNWSFFSCYITLWEFISHWVYILIFFVNKFHLSGIICWWKKAQYIYWLHSKSSWPWYMRRHGCWKWHEQGCLRWTEKESYYRYLHTHILMFDICVLHLRVLIFTNWHCGNPRESFNLLYPNIGMLSVFSFIFFCCITLSITIF